MKKNLNRNRRRLEPKKTTELEPAALSEEYRTEPRP
jgi:hypothetical protein